MSDLKEIRSRINSVQNTGQITQAMKMVATAKLRKAQMRILNLRPYAQHISSIMADVVLACNVQHPLLRETKQGNKILLVVLTSDRGLCGGFNNNICREAEKFYHSFKNQKQLDFFFIGKKAKNYFQFRNIDSVDEIFQLDKEISYDLAHRLSLRLMDSFDRGDYDSICFIYNNFKSVITQKVICETLLPIDLSEASLNKQNVFSQDLIFEVSPKKLVEDLVKKHFVTQVYRCMCESVAAEYGARMSAMENATKNAKEIISHLTLAFNKMRQKSITTELVEICSSAEVMK